MKNSLNFLWIIQMFSLHDAYDFCCPFQSHWKLRAISMCASERNYSCLFDVNFQVNVYRDKCIRPRIVGPGFKYVFQPNPNRDVCSPSRYQPFIFNTTGYSHCAFHKSLCTSEGQTTHTNGTTRSDRTCTCQAGEGYKFVKNPKNVCNCNPSSEDCSCYMYIGIDHNNNPKSLKDVECRSGIYMIERRLSEVTLNISQAFGNIQFSNCKYNLADLPTNDYRTKAAKHVLIFTVSYPLVVLVVYILQRCIPHRFQTNKNLENTERENYLKYVELIQDVARNILADVLKQRFSEGLGNALNLMKSRIVHCLNDDQKKLLYPKDPKYLVDLSDLDIHLLYIILRNTGTICPHQNNWGHEPAALDRSVSANIERIRIAKNILSHSSKCSLDNAEFTKKWKEMRECCVELGGEKYNEKIDTLLTSLKF